MKLDVDDARYKELLEKEETLLALEAGGVDNWDGYDFSMEELNNRREITLEVKVLIDSFVESTADLICENIDEPAGSGAGYGIATKALEDLSLSMWDFIDSYRKIIKIV